MSTETQRAAQELLAAAERLAEAAQRERDALTLTQRDMAEQALSLARGLTLDLASAA